jgi:PAS domain S-box-containing protein
LIGALLVWYVYIPPQFSFVLQQAASAASIAIFVIMGGLYAWIFERLTRAMQRTDAALAETRAANEKITELYRKTLELDELKSQFFANVSHELRTPLTLIMAPLERRIAYARPDGEAGREDEMMLRNARLLYRQVSDLLDAAKLEAGGMTLSYARLDLAVLIRVMASHFDSLAQERRIEYRIETPAVLTAEADGEKLQRILLNLLSNAFKFTPEGGRIEVRLGIAEGQVLIEVQDNGPGVPAEMSEAVFERFRQIEGGTNRRHGGTGLGLAIVKEFTELHGGTAKVSEAPGGGARFAVRLPLAAPTGVMVAEASGKLDQVIERVAVDELHAPLPAAAPVTPGDAPLVLVVEDNADMNAFIADALRPHYRVASAFDGSAGLEQALALTPDLILCDVMMPVMSGDAMVLELSQRPELTGVPIVMLTAKADDVLRLRLLQAGVQDYLNKPFQVDELLARVGGLLAERRRTSTQLQASERRFGELVELAPVALSTSDRNGCITLMNQAFIDLFGYRIEDTPTLAAWHEQVLADAGQLRQAESDWNERWPTNASDSLPEYVEHAALCRDGSRKSVLLTRLRLGEEMILVAMDITARKRNEDELKRRNAELERYDQASVGREIQMIELKRQVNELARQLGREPPFDLSFVALAAPDAVSPPP